MKHVTAPIARDVSDRPSTPRVRPYDPAEMTEAQRALAGIGASNVIRTLVRRDDLLGTLNPLGNALLLSERTVMRDRELAILRVALRTGTPYEWGNHTLGALMGGVTEAEIRAVADPDATWPEADAALLHAVDDLCADDCVSDATWAALRATRDEGEIIEFLVLVGYYRLMAGILNSLGVALEDGRPAYGEPPARPEPAAPGRDRGEAHGTPEGTWAVVFHHPAGDQDLRLVMKLHDGAITGSAANVASGISTDITAGTADGPRFSCTTVMTEPVRIEITYDGAVSGDTIAGEVTIKGAGAYPFDGTRVS